MEGGQALSAAAARGCGAWGWRGWGKQGVGAAAGPVHGLLGSLGGQWEGVAENLRLGTFSPHYTHLRKSSLDSRLLESEGVGFAIRVLRSGSPNVTSVEGGGPAAASKSDKQLPEAPRVETRVLREP